MRGPGIGDSRRNEFLRRQVGDCIGAGYVDNCTQVDRVLHIEEPAAPLLRATGGDHRVTACRQSDAEVWPTNPFAPVTRTALPNISVT